MRKITFTAGIVAGLLALAGCSAGTASENSSEESASGSEPVALDSIQLIVPADPGGGWDQTGRALSEALTSNDIVASAPVTNIGGAGGTVGLASLANEKDPNTLMVTGLVMVGAVETNRAETRIEDTTPIARLTEEPLLVVVPADSPHQTLEDLVQAIKTDGQDVVVTGGSAGGADHILAGLLLTEAGLSSDEIVQKLNYIPNSGGGEAVTMLLGGNAGAGISGVAEFSEFVEDGSMRALGVSSAVPAALLPEVPTITDEGYDVVLTNWRGLVAPGDISDADRAALTEAVTKAHATDAWQDTLQKRGWTDAFLTGAEFDEFLNKDISAVGETLSNIGLVE